MNLIIVILLLLFGLNFFPERSDNTTDNNKGEKPRRIVKKELQNTEGLHSSLIFSPDYREVYWSLNSQFSVTLKSGVYGADWSKAEIVTFGLEKGITEPFFSPDGKRLYFLTFQASPFFKVERERIWYIEKLDDSWGKPKPVDKVITDHPTHWQFSVASNYNLYFASEKKGVLGEQDIYMSNYSGKGYHSPVDLGPAINTGGKELTPYISPDESYLIFSRIGENTKRSDLFISFKKSGEWNIAVPLGEIINSEHHELCPIISPDKKELFFLSTRSGKSEVYSIKTEVLKDFSINN